MICLLYMADAYVLPMTEINQSQSLWDQANDHDCALPFNKMDYNTIVSLFTAINMINGLSAVAALISGALHEIRQHPFFANTPDQETDDNNDDDQALVI